MTPTQPEPGTLIAGKYRVERMLGEGGMGIVLEATHAKLGQRVAVKMLRPEVAARTDVIARFQREARIAAQLTSDHVTRVVDIGQADSGELFLVMELLEGYDLATELAQHGARPISVAVDYVLQACEALAEAHAAGLVHRDVKPANLFLARRPLGRPPIIKVLDFGLSKAPDVDSYGLTRTASTFGTPQYMSPEQVRSTKHVDARTDQHALALVLYELIAGAPAYAGPSPAATAVNIITQPPPQVRDVRPEVPHELNDALVRALAKEPDDRFADVGRFARAIAPFGGAGAGEALEAIGAALSTARRVAGASGKEAHAAPPRRSAAAARKPAELKVVRISDDSAPPESSDDAETRIRHAQGADPAADAEEDATSPIRPIYASQPKHPLREPRGAPDTAKTLYMAPSARGSLASAEPVLPPVSRAASSRALATALLGGAVLVVAVFALVWALHLGPFAR